MPVGLVEDDLAQVPELVRLRWPRRMLIVELEQRALAVADLEEAHDLAEVLALPRIHRSALDRRDDPLRDHGRLEVGRRAGFREGQVGGVAEGEDIQSPTHLE